MLILNEKRYVGCTETISFLFTDHNGHRSLSEADQSHVADVLDSDRHHVDTVEGTDGIDGHSDGDHHSLADESHDVTDDDRVHDPMGASEIEILFGTESGKHHQFDPEVYGDINQFEEFDASKRAHDSPEKDGNDFKYEMNKRLGDNIWDTEIPDDDDANLHVHTHFMNNYNPAEHPKTFKPQTNLEFRRRNNIPQMPIKDTEDGSYPHGHEHETDELAGNKILHYETRGTNRKESLPESLKENLHDKVNLDSSQLSDKHEPIDYSTLARDTVNWGIVYYLS